MYARRNTSPQRYFFKTFSVILIVWRWCGSKRLKWVMGVTKVYLSARFGGCDIEWIESIDRKTCRLFYAKKILYMTPCRIITSVQSPKYFYRRE